MTQELTTLRQRGCRSGTLIALHMPMYDAVLLDIDGTLLDSNWQHAEAWCEALTAVGYACDVQKVYGMIGMGGDKVLPTLTGLAAESPEAKALSKQCTQLFLDRKLKSVAAFPGARELLKALRARGLRLVVATSANAEELEALLKQGGIDDLLQTRTTADDAKESKPDPDIVLAALERARCAASRAIMFGDTPYDAEAAKRAGVAFVGFTCGGHAAAEMSSALAVYEGPADLLAKLESSPLAK